MVDHPCTRLQDVVDAQADTDTLGWVDASHPAAAAALGIPIPSFFLPHAGPDPTPDPKPMGERDIDLFFSGGLAEPFDRASWGAQRPEIPKVLADVIFDTVDAIDGALVPVLPAFLALAPGVAWRWVASAGISSAWH